ncbi:hypothetical protein E2C01_058537 [Portunus trituberculatus]|uniref:Uncharacterized protein n=1 Tax=Portunus trituberculatus TaxID=210409 RepID=A0A5B7GVV5_PORTR|nr:hypothetical protein [Portunus trituberculatus]
MRPYPSAQGHDDRQSNKHKTRDRRVPYVSSFTRPDTHPSSRRRAAVMPARVSRGEIQDVSVGCRTTDTVSVTGRVNTYITMQGGGAAKGEPGIEASAWDAFSGTVPQVFVRSRCGQANSFGYISKSKDKLLEYSAKYCIDASSSKSGKGALR